MKSVEQQELVEKTVEDIVAACRVESPNAFINKDYIRNKINDLLTNIFIRDNMGRGPTENID